MIRPFTFVSMLLAAGSGLYLYQAKQQARVLDRQIEDIRSDAAAMHQRAEVLRAEYTLLNDPTRLAELAAEHLPDLKPTQPGQWTSMAELDKRLPPVGEATAPPAPLEPASAAPAAPDTPALAAPPVAAASPPAAARPAAPHPSAVALAAAPHPVVTAAREPAAPAHHASPPRAVATAAVIATPRPTPRQAPAEPPAMPVVASALGMARTMFVPVTPADAAAVAPAHDRIAR